MRGRNFRCVCENRTGDVSAGGLAHTMDLHTDAVGECRGILENFRIGRSDAPKILHAF